MINPWLNEVINVLPDGENNLLHNDYSDELRRFSEAVKRELKKKMRYSKNYALL